MDYRDWLQKREATVFDRAQEHAAKETARREAEAKAGKAQTRANAPTRALPHALRYDNVSARPIGTRDPVRKAFGRLSEVFPLASERVPRPGERLDRWLEPREAPAFEGRKGKRRGYKGIRAQNFGHVSCDARVTLINPIQAGDGYTPAPKPMPPAKSASLTYRPFESMREP